MGNSTCILSHRANFKISLNQAGRITDVLEQIIGELVKIRRRMASSVCITGGHNTKQSAVQPLSGNTQQNPMRPLPGPSRVWRL